MSARKLKHHKLSSVFWATQACTIPGRISATVEVKLLRNGDDDSPRKRNGILGERRISRNGGPEINGTERRNAQPSASARLE